MNTPWSVPNGCVSQYTDGVRSGRLQSTNDEGLRVIACDVHGCLLSSPSLDKQLVASDDSIADVGSWQSPQHLNCSFIDGLNGEL